MVLTVITMKTTIPLKKLSAAKQWIIRGMVMNCQGRQKRLKGRRLTDWPLKGRSVSGGRKTGSRDQAHRLAGILFDPFLATKDENSTREVRSQEISHLRRGSLELSFADTDHRTRSVLGPTTSSCTPTNLFDNYGSRFSRHSSVCSAPR